MLTIGEYLEEIIEKCGGFGKFQVLLVLILFACKISVSWTMLMMSFAGAEPDWWCVDAENMTSSNSSLHKLCKYDSIMCSTFLYEGSMSTVVNEWDLVCDRKHIVSTITTIQMGGVLVGGLVVGQLADAIGRKPTLYFSLLLISASNIAAFFSVSWTMFAVLRFVMGISCGMLLTVYIVWMYEFLSSTKRALIAGLPSWTVFATAFALVSWLLHDWKYLHLACAGSAAPLLLSWWFMPESFRWLVTHKRFDDARSVIKKMAIFNGVAEPDLSELEKIALYEIEMQGKSRTYTLLDIFKGSYLRKNTFLHAWMWVTCGYVYYSISFNVQKLSGILYLNMFLLNVVEIPTDALSIYFNNKFGRTKTAMAFFLICGVGALGVAFVDVLDIDPGLEGRLTNGFAITSKIGIAAAWVALAVLSTEVYPTVVRNIGYGFQNTAARVGAMIAPQIIYLNDVYPGLLYFLSAGFVFLSCACAYFSSETNNVNLTDTLNANEQKEEPVIDNKGDDIVNTKL